MPAATAATDQLTYEIGGRWFGCVDHVDPDHLIGVMRRAQHAPADPLDPELNEWLTVLVSFVLTATDPAEQDAAVAALTAGLGADPQGTCDQLAGVFSGLLASFTDRQRDEIRQRILDNEAARAATIPPPAPIVPRSTLADVERINKRHGRKSTGEVIRPGG